MSCTYVGISKMVCYVYKIIHIRTQVEFYLSRMVCAHIVIMRMTLLACAPNWKERRVSIKHDIR